MKSIELFAGAGGLGMGLHQAGFAPLQVIEWDHDSCETLRHNSFLGMPLVAKWPIREVDVRQVDYKEFEGEVRLVSGGPPCQPFSLGGKHRAFADERDMFPEAVRAVREIRPDAFIFENVRGLTRTSFRNYFEYIRLQMEHPELTGRPDEDWTEHLARLEKHHTSGIREGLHYSLVTRVLNAADYGVPQRRERVLFVGFRDDLDVRWSFPEPTHSADALAWDQSLHGQYWERHGIPPDQRPEANPTKRRAIPLADRPALDPWRTVRDALTDLPSPALRLSPVEWHNHVLQPGARSYAGHTGSPIDLPAKTLKAGVHGVPGGENMMQLPDGSVRYFTVRESARLQTFPDSFQFHGSWTESMRQLGNAVPLRLAHVIGSHVAGTLERIEKVSS